MSSTNSYGFSWCSVQIQFVQEGAEDKSVRERETQKRNPREEVLAPHVTLNWTNTPWAAEAPASFHCGAICFLLQWEFSGFHKSLSSSEKKCHSAGYFIVHCANGPMLMVHEIHRRQVNNSHAEVFGVVVHLYEPHSAAQTRAISWKSTGGMPNTDASVCSCQLRWIVVGCRLMPCVWSKTLLYSFGLDQNFFWIRCLLVRVCVPSRQRRRQNNPNLSAQHSPSAEAGRKICHKRTQFPLEVRFPVDKSKAALDLHLEQMQLGVTFTWAC